MVGICGARWDRRGNCALESAKVGMPSRNVSVGSGWQSIGLDNYQAVPFERWPEPWCSGSSRRRRRIRGCVARRSLPCRRSILRDMRNPSCLASVCSSGA